MNDNNISLEIKNIIERIKFLEVNQIGKNKNNPYSDENKFPIRKKAAGGLHLSEQTASYGCELLCPVAFEQFPIRLKSRQWPALVRADSII